MKERGQRCTLTTGGHICRAEIMHHRNARDAGEQSGVANLPCAVLLGLVQDGLAVEAHDIRTLAGEADGQGMVAG